MGYTTDFDEPGLKFLGPGETYNGNGWSVTKSKGQGFNCFGCTATKSGNSHLLNKPDGSLVAVVTLSGNGLMVTPSA